MRHFEFSPTSSQTLCSHGGCGERSGIDRAGTDCTSNIRPSECRRILTAPAPTTTRTTRTTINYYSPGISLSVVVVVVRRAKRSRPNRAERRQSGLTADRAPTSLIRDTWRHGAAASRDQTRRPSGDVLLSDLGSSKLVTAQTRAVGSL